MNLANSDMTTLILFSSFVSLFLLCLGIVNFINQKKKKRELFAKIRSSADTVDSFEAASTDKANDGEGNALLNLFKRMGSRLVPDVEKEEDGSRLQFLRAGIYQKNAVSVFWGGKIFLCSILPILFILNGLFFFELAKHMTTMLLIVVLALCGFYVPDVYLKVKTELRKERMLKGLPDALDLLVVCVEAGMGMDSAINRMAQEIKLSHGDLSDEFENMNRELRAGKSRQDALRNIARRTGLDEMSSLVTMLIQTDKFGTSVSAALRIFSESFRTQRYQKAEEMAAKMPVKLLFPLILFIFPALFVVIMGPAVISIYHNIILK